eukprot:CAMPEP_0182927462 /NCGR_PEP_ID=MMETSP0105_2-20130417/13801_1 /TAXON_ID=81532 ORGANISM="Acanthoeca-like sp., Strain 10tr" /NCGR_SAMPLE_ID=MMETSP0105_2 /ASSEMBLY_ACC=CAM_ASM_000205 /LENGTH=406 /DNA_ID=CAMNT_0025065411 /DNA_START=17 /DNA_END=1233 /DNA_ORIENTATION=-
MVGAVWVATAVAMAGPAAGRAEAELQARLQTMMSELAAETGFALQLGWKSETTAFSLAAGHFSLPGSSVQKQTTTADTFLFGSGTKPFTSAAVMGLVAKGVLSLDDPASKHIDPVLDSLKPGTSLVGLFGADAAKITVGHVLRMQSGVQDFDQPDYDNAVLVQEGYMKHSPLEFVEFAANQTVKLLFEPGTQVCYSSTNYELAGFILLAHAGPGVTWDTMDMKSFFPSGVLGDLKFYTDQTISDYLTVPGVTGGGWSHLPKLSIYNQSSTVLGWTCGNMVGTTADVANFIWELLGPTPDVVPEAEVKQMEVFKPLSVGWAVNFISYGTGLMIEGASRSVKHPPTLTQLGTYMGHGGDTYGFLSEQGIAYGLNASISVIANQDGDSSFVQGTFMCKAIEVASEVLTG